jgi:hypothetical protein
MTRTSAAFVRTASLLLLISISTAPAWAQPERWTLRAGILGTDYHKRLATEYFGNVTELVLDGGAGLEVAAEYRPNRIIGWELSLGRLDVDATRRDFVTRVISFDPFVSRIELRSEDNGDFRIEPIAVALLFHPLPARRFDLYVGPQVAWVLYDIDVDGAQDHDPEPGYGGKLGAELRLGEGTPWSVALELRYLQIPHKGSDRDIYTDIGIQTAALVFGYHVGSR